MKVRLRPCLVFFLLTLALVLSACGARTAVPAPVPSPTATVKTQGSKPFTQTSVYNPSIRFERISIEQGLSQNSVNTILQDSQGFLWFGTEDGLNRYDGYTFTIYRPDMDNPSAISDRWITDMAEDQNGILWIATRQGGLNRFDPRSGLFTVYRHDPAQGSSLSDNRVRTLLFDSRDILWVGTEGGLDRFEPATETFTHLTAANGLTSNLIKTFYEDAQGILWIGTTEGLNRYDLTSAAIEVFKYNSDNPSSLSNNRINAIQEDAEGNLWIGTTDGLTRMDRFTHEFKIYKHDDQAPYSLSSNNVLSLYLDHNGGLWIGTNDGLDFFNARIDRFVHYRNQPANPNSLSNNGILSIYEDNSGVLWVGTYGGGLNKYNRQQDRFTYYRHNSDDPDGLSGNMIFPIHADFRGMIWIGTYGDGLNRFNPITTQFKQYHHDPENPNSLSSDEVYSIVTDSNGYVWVGTSRALDRLDPTTGKFKHYYPSSKDEVSLSGLPVYVLYEDSHGMLWAGTSKGIDQLEPQTETFIHYAPNPADAINQVISIAEDANNHLWIGTFGGGLHRFNEKGEGFISYFNDPKNPDSLSNNSVLSILQDRRGNLWIGTGGGGLDRYDPARGIFLHYTEKNGLPNNVIYGILEDDASDLWMSTNNGLARFNPRTEAFHAYSASDGLQSNEFNMSAYALSPRGEMYFGGINGINSFNPLKITDSAYVPSVTLTSIMHEGQPIKTDQQVQFTRDITLAWPQNEFEFEFAALAYGQPSRNQHAYMLEGFDRDWNYIGTRRNGRYTNLPGGSYTLLLNGSNSDGVWSEAPVRIRVTVIPPVWETLWFRLLAILVLVTVIAGGTRLRLGAVQRRNRELADLVRLRTGDLEKRTLEIETLYEADEKILRTVSFNQVFQTLVNVSVDSLKADRSAVFVWNEEKSLALPRVSHGFSPRTLAVMKFAKGEGMVGEVFATGKPVIVPEINPDDLRPDIREAIIAEGIHSFVHLPIKIDNQTVGVFNVGFTRPGAINDDIVRLFTALVQRASLSITNMQLFEQTKDLAVMEERNRLARELHDSAKQKAFAALAQLGTANGIMSRNPMGAKPHLNEAENLVYEVIQELTFLIQEIYPIALQEQGLPATLREYVFEWENRNDIPANLTICNSRRLNLGTEQAIYRIIQESLANIARHSHSSQVEVSLVYHPEALEVSIADNGKGFDVNQKIRGMGLRSMRERVGSIHGSVQIQSAPGQGTRVLIQAPLKKQETERSKYD